jgi:hypothetical protein
MSNEMEHMLAVYCAPVLLGKKPAALFARPYWWQETVATQALDRLGLRVITLHRLNKSPPVFVYHQGLLDETLKHETVTRHLVKIGYTPWNGVQSSLEHLMVRFHNSREFPHEIGFFLGYPPEDVLGFIHHRNQGCKLCGQWKVYSDVNRARGMFTEYDRCKQTLLDYIRRGGSIEHYCPME